MQKCKRDIFYWFDNWGWTYDPRRVAEGKQAHLPFLLYPRQREMVQFIADRIMYQEEGLIEKSRDIGFTWMIGGFALHRWLWHPGFKTTFGSRKEQYVDRRGDPDSIFGKIRLLMLGLPRWMRPQGFDVRQHDNHMRLVNPVNGNIISGEAGDQMGRGGRSTLYVIDEGAHIERADNVEAATSATADVRIWASSVNGMANLFARKRHGGTLKERQIFRFHYTDDPRKTPDWAKKKKATLEEHVWAAEYDIDYSASIEGICIPAKWVQSALKLRDKIKVEPSTRGIGGLDVGAGKAKSVFVGRLGPVVSQVVSWGDPDTIDTAHKGLNLAADTHLIRSDKHDCFIRTLNYDSIGVGKGVQAALTRHGKLRMTTNPINVGVSPSDAKWPDGETSQEKFANLKAELWFLMRERFKASHELLLYLNGEGGRDCDPSECIVLPPLSDGPDVQILVSQISLPKWGRNEKGKIIIEGKDSLAKRDIPSPDHAEALSLTFAGSMALSSWGIGDR